MSGSSLQIWLAEQVNRFDAHRTFSFWYAAFDFLSKIALMGGIVFSLYQFFAFQNSERIKYTIQFVEKYDGANFLRARQTISAVLRQHEGKIAQLSSIRISPNADAKLRARMAQFLVKDSNNKEGIAKELDLVVRFFNGLQICIENNLCDRSIADAFLLAHAKNIWLNFGPYIVSRRKIISGYGLGIELFQKAGGRTEGG